MLRQSGSTNDVISLEGDVSPGLTEYGTSTYCVIDQGSASRVIRYSEEVYSAPLRVWDVRQPAKSSINALKVINFFGECQVFGENAYSVQLLYQPTKNSYIEVRSWKGYARFGRVPACVFPSSVGLVINMSISPQVAFPLFITMNWGSKIRG